MNEDHSEKSISYASAATVTARWAVMRASADGGREEELDVRQSALAALDAAIDAALVKRSTRTPPMLDVSTFTAWLVRQPSMARCAPRELNAENRYALHPCGAVSWIAAGEVLTPEQIRARIAGAAQLRGVLRDAHDGRLLIDAETQAVTEQLMLAETAFLDAFREDAARLSRAVVTGAIGCVSADYGRSLHAGDFACPIKLDALAGCFRAEAMAFDDDWDQALAACRRIGQVRVSGREIQKHFGPRSTTAAARRRGADALRARFEQWRLGAAPLPKRARWVSGQGLEIVGNKHAAGAVWTEVTRDPVYAPARRAGRRRA